MVAEKSLLPLGRGPRGAGQLQARRALWGPGQSARPQELDLRWSGVWLGDQIISFQPLPLALQSVFHCVSHLPWVVRTLGFPRFIGVPHQRPRLRPKGQEH